MPGPKESLASQSGWVGAQGSAAVVVVPPERGDRVLCPCSGAHPPQPQPQPGSRQPTLTADREWGARACTAAGGSMSISSSLSISSSTSIFSSPCSSTSMSSSAASLLLPGVPAASSTRFHTLSRKPSRKVHWWCPRQPSAAVGQGARHPCPLSLPRESRGVMGRWARPQQELAGGWVAPWPPAPTGPDG